MASWLVFFVLDGVAHAPHGFLVGADNERPGIGQGSVKIQYDKFFHGRKVSISFVKVARIMIIFEGQ